MNPVPVISIQGARQHNLQNISVTIPRNTLTVITGVSGSGKSSLAIDTLYSEGQRRYVESLSAYARQFLGVMDAPDIDAIDGLSPAICIKQKGIGHNPRSTVGTLTEIYDHLRLLYAHTGTVVCRGCGDVVEKKTVQQMCDALRALPAGTRLQICAPVAVPPAQSTEAALTQLIEGARSRGFVRMRINGETQALDDIEASRFEALESADIVIDRLVVKPDMRQRLSDSLETALSHSATGTVVVDIPGDTPRYFSGTLRCPRCDIAYTGPSPGLFSFNSHQGACPACHGLGYRLDLDPERIVPDPDKSLADGAVVAWNAASREGSWTHRILQAVSSHYDIPLDVPFKKLSAAHKNIILYGPPDKNKSRPSSQGASGISGGRGDDKASEWLSARALESFEGVVPNLQRRYTESGSEYIRKWIESFMHKQPCSVCNGTRLTPDALAVQLHGKNIAEACALSLERFSHFIDTLALDETGQRIAAQVLKEIRQRVEWLCKLGLSYLTLDRLSPTLSGGEVQRIRLAAQLGSRLSGVLYILDEPSVGLHMADNAHLIEILKALRDLGNTVIVIEHDRDMIQQADHCIDMGPGAGTQGGRIVARGTPGELADSSTSVTGTYLRSLDSLAMPQRYRPVNARKKVTLHGAHGHNLARVTLSVPLDTLCCVTGVSGSGKSSLVLHTLYPAIKQHLLRRSVRSLPYTRITGVRHIRRVVTIDQTPIGVTPRSNPATYTRVFDPIRKLFAATTESKKRGYTAARFSFNLKGGRCEACNGDGIHKVEMHFLPDVYVQCDVCKGKRYNRETLDILYKGKSVADVLDMSVDEALQFFRNFSPITTRLSTLSRIGLGYLHLGQPAPTLSGGEAQRIKLAAELSKTSTRDTLFLLDEPTTGLHFRDIEHLITLLNGLVDKGNTVLVIEHNPDVIKCADYVVDLGPGGGENGGTVVAQGTPLDICQSATSVTGRYLRAYVERGH
jgi:excinuclease ABC subunit A